MIRAPIKVFVLDDHPLVCEWLIHLLQTENGIEVIGSAADAANAIAEIQNLQPDVAVIDLSLKHGSGMEVIKAIRLKGLPTRPLVLSMYEDIGDIERALRAGACGYVMKHESSGQIVNAIREVHAGRIFAAPAVVQKLAERRINSRDTAHADDLENLSDRELEVLRRLGSGHKTRRIADDLGVTLKTIQTYCARIKEKLGLKDEIELLRRAIALYDTEHLKS